VLDKLMHPMCLESLSINDNSLYGSESLERVLEIQALDRVNLFFVKRNPQFSKISIWHLPGPGTSFRILPRVLALLILGECFVFAGQDYATPSMHGGTMNREGNPMPTMRLRTNGKSPFKRYVHGYGRVGRIYRCDSEPMEGRAVFLDGKLYFARRWARRFDDSDFSQSILLQGSTIGSEIELDSDVVRLWHATDAEEPPILLANSNRCAGCGKTLTGTPPQCRAIINGYAFPLCQPEHLDLLNAVIAGSEGGISGAALGPSTEWTRGNKQLLYVIVQYSDQSSPPTSRSTAESALSQVNQYYQIQSYQQTSVTGTVTDPIILSESSNYYMSVGAAQLYNDAVAAARLAGWDADAYDFVFIRHVGGPGGLGTALVGQKGAWVQSDNWTVIAHELGHNYGLNHANAWRPSTSSPYGPGDTVEYADPFDLMGPNRGSFNTYEKSVLHWLPDTARMVITNSRIIRLHAFDVSTLVSNQIYSLQISKDTRDYWLDYRGEFKTGPYAPFTLNGLQVRWAQWSQSRGGSTLLDTTPGSARQFDDGPLALGHTYSDWEAGIHVTVVARSSNPGEWLDVSVQFASSGSNLSPHATLLANSTNVSTGEPVGFAIDAADPDGDPLAFGWRTSDAGSGEPLVVSSNSPALTYSWNTVGDYEVRCRVSDTKGGATVVRALIHVSASAGYSISGLVTNETGLPMSDVLVYSLPASVSTNDPNYVTQTGYRATLTDEAGNYSLLNLSAGQQVVRILPTTTTVFAASNGTGEVTLGPDYEGLNFVGLPKPNADVRGIVMDGSQAVSNVILRIGGLSTVSGTDGTFVFSNLPPASYVLTAAGDDQFISPDNPIYVNGADVINITAQRVLYSVQGVVRGAFGLVQVGTGEPGRTAYALPMGLDWVYQLNVPRGIWNLEANLSGYTFRPDGFANPVIISGTDVPLSSQTFVQPTSFTNLDFLGSFGTTYSIRGRITLDGDSLPSATIAIENSTALSDSLGNYALTGLLPGSYNLTASLEGYTFTHPAFSNPITVGPNVTSVDFLAFSTSPSPPVITSQPQSLQVNEGASAIFDVTATGSPPLVYQWYFNVTNLINDATGSSLTISNVQDSDAGYYSVVVDNGLSVTSSNALLTVNHLPVPASPVLERLTEQSVKLHTAYFLGTDPDGDTLQLESVGPVSVEGGSVTSDSLWVQYTPPPGLTNADSFNFIVNDGRGGTRVGTATVIVVADAALAQNLTIESLGNGEVRLVFDAIPDRTYSVEYSERLDPPDWRPLSMITADEFGVAVSVDSPPMGSSQRFYRIVWP
jgi:Immunoglobulin domain/Bacterial Ig domain/PKD domain/Carboxypeptidase regulatory-like domain/Metallo-peptidase family M12B Reprolysin-like